jgi:hypothetical protein
MALAKIAGIVVYQIVNNPSLKLILRQFSEDFFVIDIWLF